MDKVKALFLALALGILFIPLSIFLKKFTTLEAYEKPKVKFDPMICYACEDCPCIYTLDDGVKYRLSKTDKYICELPEKDINSSISKANNEYTAFLDIKDYLKFEDCVKWYSLHPSAY